MKITEHKRKRQIDESNEGKKAAGKLKKTTNVLTPVSISAEESYVSLISATSLNTC